MASDSKEGTQGPPDFEELTLKDGTVVRDCRVVRQEVDGLLLQHSAGIVHVSFFDLENEIRDRYQFDPVAALRVYQMRLEEQREMRKERLLLEEKKRAEQTLREEENMRYALAEENWRPVEARVIASNDAGVFVYAKEIVFVPRTKKSTLGFTVPDTPKRELKRFGDGMIFLKNLTSLPKAGSLWQGFVDPTSIEMENHPTTGGRTVPVHEAISKRS